MLTTMVMIHCCLPVVCVVHSLFISPALCPFRSSHVCHVHYYTRPVMMVIVDDDRFYMAGDDVDDDDDDVVVDVYNGTDGDDD